MTKFRVFCLAVLMSLAGVGSAALAADQDEAPAAQASPANSPDQAAPADQAQPEASDAPGDASSADQAAPDASQTGINDPRRKNPPVVFQDVDFQDSGSGTGKITLSGRGDPGARLLLFFDAQPFGQVMIGQDGSWSFEKEGSFPMGQHIFRADRIDETNGIVIGSASINVARAPQSPQSPQ